MSNEILLEYLLRSKELNFTPIAEKAARDGELFIVRTLFDRGLIDHVVTLSAAAEMGNVELVDEILNHWDYHFSKNRRGVRLTDMLDLIIAQACQHNRMNIIRYLFEEKDFFRTYYSQQDEDDGKLLENVQHVKPDPESGLEDCTTLELAQYFAAKGATNFDECMRQASEIGNLDMLKYALCMYQQISPQPDEDEQKQVMVECLLTIVKKGHFSLLQYLAPYHYDLTVSLLLNLVWQCVADERCGYFLVQCINEDIGRFNFAVHQSVQRDCRRATSTNDILALLNYGLTHQIIKKLQAQMFDKCLTWHNTKCELLKRYFCFVLPSDVFSMLKCFLTYDTPPPG